MKQSLLLLLVLVSSYSALAQQLISGIVADQIGGVPNVNVLIKGSDKGTITNTEGFFEILINSGDVLVVSHVGYKTENVTFTDQKQINVIFENYETLDEVLVVSLGFTRCSSRTVCSTRCSFLCFVSEDKNEVKKQVVSSQGLKLYPNPSPNGVFTLSLDKPYEKVALQVATISGQIISSKTFYNVKKPLEIDVSNYPIGMYLINTIADGEMLATKKGVVSR